MLAHPLPRDLFATESDMHKALSMGMDLSPSQLVTHPAQSHRFDVQSVINAQSQSDNGSLQASPLQQRAFLQSLTPLDLSFLMQGAPQPLQQTGDLSSLPGPSSDHGTNLHNVQVPLSMGDGMNTSLNSASNLPESRSPSSASSEHRPQSTSFSRRTDGGGSGKGSPKSAPAEITSFGRLNHGARQRTAQACEKCRDRKTKCSGTKPTCKRCADRGLQCVWAPDTRVRGPSRHPRQSRFDAGGNTGEPLSALPVPLLDPSSGESSPVFHGRDYASSAPAFQTTFPAISLPSHLVMRDQQKRQSWHEGAFYPGGVARGLNALSIMGEPIRPLSAVDDCWYPVENAKMETSGRDRGATIRARERRKSVSVAHLALARNQGEDQVVPKDQVPEFFDLSGNYSSAPQYMHEHNNDSLPPSSRIHPTLSSGTSESEPSLSIVSSRHSSSVDQGLHQPSPSYDVASKLSDEMMNLLNFPGAYNMHSNEQSFLDGMQAFSGAAYGMNESNASKPVSFTIVGNEAKDTTDEIFAQYFDADAFEKMNE
ncbi:hypothetical protein ACEPAF_4604 [Sanghuangporus sanghuang]